MTEQTSRLAIILDSSGAQRNAEGLTGALVKMAQAGEQAEKATDNLSKAAEDLNSWLKVGPKHASENAKSIKEQRQEIEGLLGKLDPTSKAFDELDKAMSRLSKAKLSGVLSGEDFNHYSSIIDQTRGRLQAAQDELTGYTKAQREAAKAAQESAAQQAQQEKVLAQLQAKLDPTTAALKELDAQQRQVFEHAYNGSISMQQYDTYSAKIAETRREVNGEAKAARDAAKAHEEQRASLLRLKAQLDPVGAAFERLAQQQKQLDSAKASGMLSPDMYDKLSGSLANTRKNLEITQDTMKKTGVTSRAMAHQMRMIPMQMTDIVVSLAAGQAPMTVLLQQGGQLKDMFGGIGPAFQAVSRYALGLVNPFTLSAAAVAGLGIAYYQGSKEQTEFNKSLVMTGNTVGKTTGQLSDIAARAGLAAKSTTGAAASVLNQLVSAGKVAGDSLERVTTTIVKTSQSTGISTDKLVDDFNKIAANPVQAITELNDKYHHLTLATYNQVKALQDEGNQQAAAKLATDAHASAMQQRSTEILSNLGTIERGWNTVTSAIKNATDAALDFGRIPSTGAKRQDAFSEWQLAEKNYKALSKNLNVDPNYNGNNPLQKADADRLRTARQQVDLRKKEYEAVDRIYAQEGLTAARERQRNDEQQKGISAQQYVDDLKKKSLSNEEKRLAAQEALTQKIKEGAKVSKEEEARIRKNIDDSYKDPKQHKEKSYSEDAATRLLDQLNQQNVALRHQLDMSDRLGASQQALVKWKAQIAEIEGKSILTADQKSLLANKEKITALYQQNAEIERREQMLKQIAQLDGYQSNINRDIDSRKSKYSADELSASGAMSAYQQGVLTQRVGLEQQINDKIIQLRQQRTSATTEIDRQTIDKEIAMQQAANAKMLADYDNHIRQMDVMRGSWSNGAARAWQEYSDSASDSSSMTQTLFSNAFSSMEDSIVAFTTTGKLSFSGFANSVISDISRIAARMAISGLAGSAISAISSSFFNSPSAGVTPSGAYSGAASNIKFNALGGVYDSPSLSSFSNQVYDKPKLFAFAKGAGIFGEAGPEAIMPLTRGSDGSLGVRAVGSGGSSGGDINLGGIVVNVNNQGQASATGTDAAGIGKQIQQAVVNMINDQANRQGTPLWRAINKRQ